MLRRVYKDHIYREARSAKIVNGSFYKDKKKLMHNQGLIPYYKYLIYRYGSQYINDFFRDQNFPIHKEDGEFGFDFFAIMAPDYELFDCYTGKNLDAEWEAYRSFENRVREDILTLIKIMKIDKIRRNLYSLKEYNKIA